MPKGVPNKRYSGEFKQKVIEYMMENKLSYNETGRLFEISGEDRVCAWEQIYLEEGAEGLYIKRRGRMCGEGKGRPRKLDKQIEEDLVGILPELNPPIHEEMA